MGEWIFTFCSHSKRLHPTDKPLESTGGRKGSAPPSPPTHFLLNQSKIRVKNTGGQRVGVSIGLQIMDELEARGDEAVPVCPDEGAADDDS
jgi:hypothetical protein